MEVFTPDGTYSAFGDTYQLDRLPQPGGGRAQGPVHGRAPRSLELDGDTGTGQQPLCFVEQTTHDMRIGYYTDTYRRTDDGWRLHTRSMTFLRKSGIADAGRPHDPTRPRPDGRADGARRVPDRRWTPGSTSTTLQLTRRRRGHRDAR